MIGVSFGRMPRARPSARPCPCRTLPRALQPRALPPALPRVAAAPAQGDAAGRKGEDEVRREP
eukprot:scaffold1610_cov257-Pinguiococcus_pyrenoidosus.AAC.8